MAAALSARRQAGHGGAWRGIGLGSLQRNATIRGAQEGKTWKIMENRLNLCESLECMRSVISKD